jgi:hypothetical protein
MSIGAALNVPEGQNMNSRGRQPTVRQKSKSDPARGRTISFRANRGRQPAAEILLASLLRAGPFRIPHSALRTPHFFGPPVRFTRRPIPAKVAACRPTIRPPAPA